MEDDLITDFLMTNIFDIRFFFKVMSMKLAEFMEKYNGDIAVYQRQFASADDSVDNLLISDTDLNPKSVVNNNNEKKNNNNNKKVADEEEKAEIEQCAKTSSSSSSSPPRKRHSDEENLESTDTLGPLPAKNANHDRTQPHKTPAHPSSSSSKTLLETPAAAGRPPLTACTPMTNARAPRRSELENPNLASKLVLLQESKTGSPLAQELSDMGTPELKKIQAQIDRMMKMKTSKN